MLGKKCLMRTDQKNLKFLLEQRLVSLEHQKWLSKLLGYDFDIQYRPGAENKSVDALSQLEPTATSLSALIIPPMLGLEEVHREVAADEN